MVLSRQIIKTKMEVLKQNKQKFWDMIAKYNSFLLCLHVNADADSLCSNVAMSELLVQMGKKVTILDGKNFSFSKDLHNLGWLQFVSNHRVEELHLELMDKPCFIMLDASNEDRLHDMGDKMTLPKIVVDHHLGNNIVGAELSIVDTEFSSASQMVYELGEGHGPFTTDYLQAVFMGMYGDTGGFRHGLSARVFEIASVIQKQVDMQPLINTYNNSVGPDDMAMLAIATNHMELFNVGSICFCITVISNEEMSKYSEITNETNSNFVVRTLGQQKGIDVLIVANQGTYFKWRVRFRSFGQNNYAKIMAESIGGGGHPMAASGTIVTDNPRTVSAIVKSNAIKRMEIK